MSRGHDRVYGSGAHADNTDDTTYIYDVVAMWLEVPEDEKYKVEKQRSHFTVISTGRLGGETGFKYNGLTDCGFRPSFLSLQISHRE